MFLSPDIEPLGSYDAGRRAYARIDIFRCETFDDTPTWLRSLLVKIRIAVFKEDVVGSAKSFQHEIHALNR